jgi:hypothetical protein
MSPDARADTASPVRTTVSVDDLSTLLQARGFRVERLEQGGEELLRSASSGFPFHIRFGNKATPDGHDHLDFTLSLVIKVDAFDLAPLVSEWNRSKRFGRLHAEADVVALEMDVLVAGGVTDNHILARVEIWDRLMHELVRSLRLKAVAP